MQRNIKIVIAVLCAVTIVVWYLAHLGMIIRPDYRCLIGTGKDVWEKGEIYKVGRNIHGAPVLKYPRLAFGEFQKEYKDAIEEVQKAFDLEPLSQENVDIYANHAWQVDTSEKDAEMRDRIDFVSKFLGIYENSFWAVVRV